jgi:hypothetical protein
MAKIKLFDTTQEITKNIKGLSSKIDELKADMDKYFNLLAESKVKAEQRARELEEMRRQEELALEKQKREEARKEAERQEKERQQR